jgi:hypothetical protein
VANEPCPGCARARDLRACSHELRGNVTAHGARSADDEGMIHAEPSYRTGSLSVHRSRPPLIPLLSAKDPALAQGKPATPSFSLLLPPTPVAENGEPLYAFARSALAENSGMALWLYSLVRHHGLTMLSLPKKDICGKSRKIGNERQVLWHRTLKRLLLLNTSDRRIIPFMVRA